MQPDQQRLIELQAEQKQLEAEIRVHRARISEIRHILTGDKDNPGLASIVEAERRRQEWIDGEPGRAAIRATPEWQAWKAQFMAEQADRVTKLMVWWEEEKARRAQK